MEPVVVLAPHQARVFTWLPLYVCRTESDTSALWGRSEQAVSWQPCYVIQSTSMVFIIHILKSSWDTWGVPQCFVSDLQDSNSGILSFLAHVLNMLVATIWLKILHMISEFYMRVVTHIYSIVQYSAYIHITTSICTSHFSPPFSLTHTHTYPSSPINTC